MFGIVRPCRRRMGVALHTAWAAHLCGLCLALRREHGQVARLTTNYDGLLASVLVQAQDPGRAPRRTAGACPLRGMRRAEVLDGGGARLAAAASLILAAATARDHVADGDGAFRHAPVAALTSRAADRWAAAGCRTAASLGFDPAPLVAVTEHQARAVAAAGPGGLLAVTAPTEAAVAAVFAHTAVLAGRPHNAPVLDEIGRLFGRIAHLLDAVEDLAEDVSARAYNPLLATGTDLAAARRYCDGAVAGLALAFDDLDLAEPALARALLVGEVRAAVRRAFRTAGGQRHPAAPPGTAPGQPGVPAPPVGVPDRRPRPAWPLWCLAGAAVGCTCGLWRPPWSARRGQPCDDRCLCGACDPCSGCSGCDCGGCDGCCDGCCCDGDCCGGDCGGC